jgi:hypothetical protein
MHTYAGIHRCPDNVEMILEENTDYRTCWPEARKRRWLKDQVNYNKAKQIVSEHSIGPKTWEKFLWWRKLRAVEHAVDLTEFSTYRATFLRKLTRERMKVAGKV